MAHYVLNYPQEGVIQTIFNELTESYLSNLRKNDTDPMRDAKTYPEVSEFIGQKDKLLSAKNFPGLFSLCFDYRTKLLTADLPDGIFYNITYS